MSGSLALRTNLSCVALAWLAIPVSADEIDRYSSKSPLRGEISAENSRLITIQVSQAGKMEQVDVPLADVADVRYEGAAGLALRTAASIERGGQLERASDAYEKAAQTAAGNGFVAQAIAFAHARTLAKAALQDRDRIEEAIRALDEFQGKYPDSRHHYPLHELLGQLHLEKGNDAEAAQALRELAGSSVNDDKLKAAVWEGRLFVMAGKFSEAQLKFDEVATRPAKTPAERLRQQEALLAKGDCLVKLKKLNEAEQLFRRGITETLPDEAGLQAATHNALGDVLREAGKPKEALLAYLEVDVVYATQKAAHAKAIYHIATIWDQLGRSSEAAETREKLKRLYPTSPWSKLTTKP